MHGLEVVLDLSRLTLLGSMSDYFVSILVIRVVLNRSQCLCILKKLISKICDIIILVDFFTLRALVRVDSLILSIKN